MSKYENGRQTREKILNSARELFWEKGYHNTTLKEIAKNAGIRQSLFFYHFENKFSLAEEIFNSFANDHDFMICSKIKEHGIQLNMTIERCVYVTSYFRLALENPNLARFIAEIDEGYVMMSSTFVKKRYEMLLEEHKNALETDTLEMIMLSNLSLNSLLFRAHVDHLISSTIDEIISFKLRQLLRSLYLDTSEVNEIISQTLKIERKFVFKIDKPFHVVYTEKAS